MAHETRQQFVLDRLRQIWSALSGIPAGDVDEGLSFIEMGFDSLFLTQAALKVKREFGVKVTFRQLFNEAPTLESLSRYVDDLLPPDALREEMAAGTAPQGPIAQAQGGLSPGALPPGGSDPLQQALALQVQASNALLALLQGRGEVGREGGSSAPAPSGGAGGPSPAQLPESGKEIPAREAGVPTAGAQIGPYRPMKKDLSEPLREELNDYVRSFMAAYEARTATSKRITAENRGHFADPRAVSGFKLPFKEIVYPIVGERSKGSRIWDVDGNEYIDCVGGFGAIFFGHAPDFVMEAVRDQTRVTVDYGPGSVMAAKAAKKICEFTGMDRATFCNTGSEAVLATMRLARTVRGRDLIATFSGDYHGIFDEVLVKAQPMGGRLVNRPVAPGIPESASQNMLVLEYGNPESLRILEERADDLAGVLIEPIQSRTPELQPREFLHEVRRITREAGVPMIFDEVITGFRLAPGGAQEWFGVESDIGAYGKVIGGGMPIGAVAGKAEYMDALDGGMWGYGDDSFPEAGVTYFAGTFVRHPLAMAAVTRVLEYMEEQGPELQKGVNRRTAWFAEETNRAFRRLGIPVELVYFGSVFLPRYRGHPDYEALFSAHLRHCGIHIWDGRPGFLTTAHTDADMKGLVDGFVQAGTLMRDAGFFKLGGGTDGEGPAGRGFEFTAAQRELWLAFRMGGNTSQAFNEQILFEIDGPVDPAMLELALDRAANRFESLRCVVREDQEGFEILPYVAPGFAFHDLTRESPGNREKRVEELVRENIDRPFDFFRGPLVRLALVRLAEDRHVLGLCVSHLICDGWSMEPVIQAVSRYYTAMVQGRQVDLGPPPSLEDFVGMEREKDEPGALAEEREFWLAEYADPLPPHLDLPTDRRRPPAKTYNGQRLLFSPDTDLVQRLRTYARARGCTLFTLLLAAYDVLLYRLTGTSDIVVGVPAAGQPNVGMLDLVVHSVNFLPLRIEVAGGEAFESLLDRVRDNFNDAKTFQDYSYGRLLQDLKLPRQGDRPPLVSVSFNVDLEFAPVLFEEVQGRFVTTPRSFVKYDLLFNFIDKETDLDLEVDLNLDLLDPGTVTAWVGAYERLLSSILDDPATPVDDLPLVDREGLREASQGPAAAEPGPDGREPSNVGRPSPANLTGWISERWDEWSDAVAVRFEGSAITYEGMDDRVKQLAQFMLDRGVEPGGLVGLCLERSPDFMVAALATWALGCAYVPMDPSHPAERLRLVWEDAGLPFLLTQSSTSHLFHAYSGETIELDSARDAIAASPKAPLQDLPDPSDLAYVIFTSGSTGRPKGVEVTRGGVRNLFASLTRNPGFDAETRVLAVSTFAFDISVVELFLPLLVGGTVVIADQPSLSDGSRLKGLLAGEAVRYLQATPATWRLLLAAGWDGNAEMTAVCTGERFPEDLAKDLFPRVGSLWNFYGPTETTVYSTLFRLRDGSGPVPIGRPLENTRCHVLDDRLNPVPQGAPGELFIGGAGVARGYLGRPDLTVERFLPDPFSSEPNARMYRTGDMVRLSADGNLEFLHRVDHQVKIRGFRIELGEIEAVLGRHPSVSQCAVSMREDVPGDPVLVAYAILTGDGTLTSTDMREFLREWLPEYMIPRHLSIQEEFPLTPSGKVDRDRLPAPGPSTAAPALKPPETEEETYLAEVWRDLLGVEIIGVEDNFFDLGGHSLLAVKATNRIKGDRGVEVPLRAFLLENLEEMARYLGTKTTRPTPAEKG